jgi:metal-dependent amidase/aminoacylase/carboxypeptidase family protein
MLSVEYFGKAAHAAAAPWDGINALHDAMVISYQNISALRQQMQASNRVHGIIKKGGEAPNIVPDYTQAEYFGIILLP